jgi:hypothetical protein
MSRFGPGPLRSPGACPQPSGRTERLPFGLPFLPAKYGIEYGKMSLPTLGSPEKPTNCRSCLLPRSEWGSGGRGFKSRRPERLCANSVPNSSDHLAGHCEKSYLSRPRPRPPPGSRPPSPIATASNPASAKGAWPPSISPKISNTIRKVALKVLKAELLAVLSAERFVQEIKTTARLCSARNGKED